MTHAIEILSRQIPGSTVYIDWKPGTKNPVAMLKPCPIRFHGPNVLALEVRDEGCGISLKCREGCNMHRVIEKLMHCIWTGEKPEPEVKVSRDTQLQRQRLERAFNAPSAKGIG